MTVPDYIREAWGHVMEGPEMVEILRRTGVHPASLADLESVTPERVERWCTGGEFIPPSTAAALRLMDREMVPDVVFSPDLNATNVWSAPDADLQFTAWQKRQGEFQVAVWSAGGTNLKGTLGTVPTLPLARDLCRGYLLGLKERG